MSGRMKQRLINHEPTYKIVIESPSKKKKLLFLPEKHLEKLEAFLEKYGSSDAILWEKLASGRIAKYKKLGLVLRGARYREGLSQKELAKLTGISQENISKMENGIRPIGKKIATKLALALKISSKVLTD